MILADTSVWIDHFRNGSEPLVRLLENEEILIHPMVIGELACGHLPDREQVLEDLASLPTAGFASHAEVMSMIEDRALMGKGIGYIDAHLLAAVQLTPDTHLWTLDKRLAQVAAQLSPY